MNISLILFNKTLSMMLMALIGYVLVKRGLLHSEDKRALNIINLYAVSPCVILTAFQVALTPDKVNGLITAFAGAISVHIIFLLLARLLVRPLGLNQAEQASLIYSNAGNMILPLVSTILGEEYTLYACAYMAVQNVIIWSHGVTLLSGSGGKFNLKKVVLNPNILAIGVGLFLFFGQITLPDILYTTASSMGKLIGPQAMFIMGMIVAESRLSECFRNPKTYLVCFGRLIFFPLVCILLLRLTGLSLKNELIHTALLATLLAASAPVASNVTMLALLYDGDVKSASRINVMTLFFCAFTMPLMVLVYQNLC